MRAPDSAGAAIAHGDKQRRRHVGLSRQFSREQCEKIERSLTSADVAPDVARALRDKIQGLALSYGLRSRLRYRGSPVQEPTPKQQAAELRREVAGLDAALDVLSRYATRYSVSLDPDLDEGNKRRRAVSRLHAARQPLLSARDKARQRLEALATARKPGHQRHTYTQYWTRLAGLWMGIVPNAASRRHRHAQLQGFLRVCTEPVFPAVVRDANGKPSDGALIAFTERHFRRTVS